MAETRMSVNGNGSLTDMSPVINIRDITKSYQMGTVTLEVLKGVNLTIERGEFVSIMGPSGSGKSTLMNVLGALAVFQFMWTWNNFIIPYLYLQREELRTLPLGLMLFSGRYGVQYDLLFAGITVATLPIVVLYVMMQRKIVEGLTAGALKG